jgi:multicomponent Na+:H+ antiporter subunit E
LQAKWVKRFTLFFVIWLVLTAGAVSALPFGLAAAFGATWMSLRLLPPGSRNASLFRLAAALPAILARVIWGAVDVARRALDPKLPMDAGWIAYRTRLPRGSARIAFCSETSLLPGSLATGADGDTLHIHTLDIGQDIAAQLRREEERIARVAGIEDDGRNVS